MFGKKYFAYLTLASIFLYSAHSAIAPRLAKAQSSNTCAQLGSRTLYINANGYEGTLKISGLTPISPGYKFEAQLTLEGGPTEQIVEGRCRNRNVLFTRKSANQNYSGWILGRGTYGIAGTFSYNGLQYGWYAN